MSQHSPAAVTLHSVSFDWPDGSQALASVSGSFSTGRTGLVGNNGAGKSTLLRLIAGELTPSAGHIDAAGDVATLPQQLTLAHSATVADLLGIAPTLEALRAIAAGDVAQHHFDTIGHDWDVESRAAESLQQLGFGGMSLDRSVAALSGGEAMLIAIVGLRIRSAAITLLDEPTNNLDRPTRARLGELVESWPGTLIVVSHDLELLERMEHTAELWGGELTSFGGPYSEWRAQLEVDQAAAAQSARAAKQALKTEKRQRVEAEQKLAQRARTAKQAQRDGGIPKIVAGNLASKARASAGAMRTTLDGRVQQAQRALTAADARLRDTEHIHVTLPDPGVPRGRRIAEFVDPHSGRTVMLQGPERFAITGPNGSGKTTLLRQLLGGPTSSIGTTLFAEHVGYLPQRLSEFDESLSAVANVRASAPALSEPELRNQLARLLLRGSVLDRPVSTLSGGERFRVALAKLLLADPPAQVLVFDEPTNNLDIASVEQLAEALDAYRGALIVVSHDEQFLSRIGVTTAIELDGAGGFTERVWPAPTAG